MTRNLIEVDDLTGPELLSVLDHAERTPPPKGPVAPTLRTAARRRRRTGATSCAAVGAWRPERSGRRPALRWLAQI